MQIVGVHKICLPRQAHEGQLIGEYQGDKNPQQKGGVEKNFPPKLILEDQEQYGDSNNPQAHKHGQNHERKRKDDSFKQL